MKSALLETSGVTGHAWMNPISSPRCMRGPSPAMKQFPRRSSARRALVVYPRATSSSRIQRPQALMQAQQALDKQDLPRPSKPMKRSLTAGNALPRNRRTGRADLACQGADARPGARARPAWKAVDIAAVIFEYGNDFTLRRPGRADYGPTGADGTCGLR
jgi:hypothetical protein